MNYKNLAFCRWSHVVNVNFIMDGLTGLHRVLPRGKCKFEWSKLTLRSDQHKLLKLSQYGFLLVRNPTPGRISVKNVWKTSYLFYSDLTTFAATKSERHFWSFCGREENACRMLYSSTFDITYRILYPIELSFVPKSIGDKEWHNNSFMMRAKAWLRLWPLKSDGRC